MKLRTVAASLLLMLSATSAKANVADVGAPVPIYTEAELIKLIEQNKHLERVRADNCQLVEDIVARATRINLPSYEFLYGDMLAWVHVGLLRRASVGVFARAPASHFGAPPSRGARPHGEVRRRPSWR